MCDAISAYFQEIHAKNDMNIFPIKRASKEPFGEWKFLQSTRLPNDKLPDLLATAPSNYAVVLGRKSRDLFCVDCDSPSRFKDIKGYLESKKIRTWVRSSARGGQFFLYSGDGEVCTDKSQSEVDILGKGTYSMLPHSIHPDTGEIIDWIEQPACDPETVSIIDVPELRLKLATAGENNLPRVAYNILVCADYSEYQNDKSRGEFAAVQSLRSKGYSDSEIVSLFNHHRPPHFSRIGEKEFVRAFINYKREDFNFDSNLECCRKAERLIVWLCHNPLVGSRSAKTDTKVLQAIAEICKKSGSYRVSVSVRQLCKVANIGGLTTAANALHRLVDGRFIFPINATQMGMARFYEINFSLFPDLSAVALEEETEFVRSGDSSNDAFHHYALGATGEFILKNLSTETGKSAKELKDQSKTNIRTVYRKLDRLISNGLCFYDNSLYYATEFYDADLNQAAYALGTKGKTDTKFLRFAEQRQHYAYKVIKSQMMRHAAKEENTKGGNGKD